MSLVSHLRIEFFRDVDDARIPPEQWRLMQRAACGFVIEMEGTTRWCNDHFSLKLPTCPACAVWYDRLIELGVEPFAWDSSALDAWRAEQPTAAASSRPT